MSMFRKSSLPVFASLLVFVFLYGGMSLAFPAFFSLRVFTNLFIDNAHIGIIALGMTFVILSGGIDLSVGSVLAFTTIFIAWGVTVAHLHPGLCILLALVLGAGFGAAMGGLIHGYDLPPFLVTLGGMFLARGLAFMVSTQSLEIQHPFYSALSDFRIALPGHAALTLPAMLFLLMLARSYYIAHCTRLGRNIYAIGGSEFSAVLMGLPVARTKIFVYGFSGFCAALGGVALTFYQPSGAADTGVGLELDAIAAVVIGGTVLTGGRGYVLGTLIGILIYGSILTGIDFHGGLDTSWRRISIGALLFLFILMQRLIPQTCRSR